MAGAVRGVAGGGGVSEEKVGLGDKSFGEVGTAIDRRGIAEAGRSGPRGYVNFPITASANASVPAVPPRSRVSVCPSVSTAR